MSPSRGASAGAAEGRGAERSRRYTLARVSSVAGDPELGTDRVQAARRALDENPDLWYHSIELAPGVVTPGFIDLRKAAAKVLPDDLSGKRVLDVGTFDGFWAFEMERRGAEVVAIDIEDPSQIEFPPLQRERIEERREQEGFELGKGFRLAAEVLGSAVTRVPCNVYDLAPERIGGRVDFAFCGAILTHLRDPVRGLERMREALVEGGELRIFEPFSVALTVRAPRKPSGRFLADTWEYTWWLPNLAGIHGWARAALFTDVGRVAIVRPPSNVRTAYAAFSARAP
jgi:SAM-dependent methyltransferase